MVLMKKRGNKTKTKSSLVDYYAPVTKWEDEKKIIRQSTIAGSNCRVEPEG